MRLIVRLVSGIEMHIYRPVDCAIKFEGGKNDFDLKDAMAFAKGQAKEDPGFAPQRTSRKMCVYFVAKRAMEWYPVSAI